MLTAVRTYPKSILHSELQGADQREVALEAVSKEGEVLDFLSPDLKNDQEIVLAAVRQNGLALRFAGPILRKDRKVVLAAVQNCDAVQYADPSLWNDKEVRKLVPYPYFGN